MIRPVAEQINRLSEVFALMPSDIVFSRTPADVGPVVRGTSRKTMSTARPPVGARNLISFADRRPRPAAFAPPPHGGFFFYRLSSIVFPRSPAFAGRT